MRRYNSALTLPFFGDRGITRDERNRRMDCATSRATFGEIIRAFTGRMLRDGVGAHLRIPRGSPMRNFISPKRNAHSRRMRTRVGLRFHPFIGVSHQHSWNNIVEKYKLWRFSISVRSFLGNFGRYFAIRTAKTEEKQKME